MLVEDREAVPQSPEAGLSPDPGRSPGAGPSPDPGPGQPAADPDPPAAAPAPPSPGADPDPQNQVCNMNGGLFNYSCSPSPLYPASRGSSSDMSCTLIKHF